MPPTKKKDEAPDVKVQEQPSQLYVSKSFGKAAPEGGDPEVIAIHRFLTEPAKVEVAMGLTLNLGNYESARVEVRVSVPVYREEINDAFAYVKKYVEKRVNAEVEEIRAAANKKSNDVGF